MNIPKLQMPLHYKIEPEKDFWRIYIECKDDWKAVNKTTTPEYVPVSQRFGANDYNLYAAMGLKGHNGIDWVAPDFSKVYAMYDGTVIGWSLPNGLLSIMSDDLGDGKVRQVYCHLDSLVVKIGDKVNAGDLIAYSDNRSTIINGVPSSTGSHLHSAIMLYEKINGEFICNTANGYGGAVDFINQLDYKITMSLQDDLDNLKKDKLALEAFRADFKKKNDLKLVYNQDSQEFAWCYGGILMVFEKPTKNEKMILSFLLRQKGGVSISQVDWDRLPKI